MKHKRQTLGKQGEDGDDKDSINSDGGKSGKHSSDKFLDDEMSKKSCQGCEMPTAGICAAHDELPDIGLNRGNNNNTPSATNNNTSFNNNSNGASSIGSASSFDKMITEEDSRSNEDSGTHSSPRIGKKGTSTPTTVPIKSESRRNSPNSCDRKTGMSKISPGVAQKDPGLLHTSTDPVSVKMSSKAIPGAPALHPSPLGMNPGNNMMYPHLQRSSPATATAIASATVTIQNLPNSVPPFVSRAAPGNHFPNQYQMNNQAEYKPEGRPKNHQQQYHVNQSLYNSTDMYGADHAGVQEGFARGQHNASAVPHASRGEMSSRMSGRARQIYHSTYPNQQQYYYNKNHGPPNEPYGHNLNNQSNYTQGYHSEHSYNHYGYPGANMYPNDGTETMGAHVPNPVHMGHDPSATYYPNDGMHPMHKVQNQAEYPNKVGYYDGSYNGSTQMTPSTEPSSYVHSEVYQAANSATAMASAAVMTPPASVQTDVSENYNSYHQFYPGENTQTQVVPTGDNSNSSSDFNFLSNLANDYTPEYYQI